MVVIILSPPENSLRLRPRCGAHTSRFDSTNLLTQAFPRTAAVGERLWSARNVTEVYDAGVGLHAWCCRLLRRGLATAPVTGGLAIGAFGTAPRTSRTTAASARAVRGSRCTPHPGSNGSHVDVMRTLLNSGAMIV